MTVARIAQLLDADFYCGEDLKDVEILSGFGCDIMSDALAYMNAGALFLTGLVNPQVIRTAEMMDVSCIVLVRGKQPTDAMVELAKERNMALLSTRYRLFNACGILYAAGMPGGGKVE
jgi:predicted transcriptional regulator